MQNIQNFAMCLEEISKEVLYLAKCVELYGACGHTFVGGGVRKLSILKQVDIFKTVFFTLDFPMSRSVQQEEEL